MAANVNRMQLLFVCQLHFNALYQMVHTVHSKLNNAFQVEQMLFSEIVCVFVYDVEFDREQVAIHLKVSDKIGAYNIYLSHLFHSI